MKAANQCLFILILFFISSNDLHAEEYVITQIMKNGVPVQKDENVLVLSRDSRNIYRIMSENKNIIGWYLSPGDMVQIETPGIEVVLRSGTKRFSISPSNIKGSLFMVPKDGDAVIQGIGSVLYMSGDKVENNTFYLPSFSLRCLASVPGTVFEMISDGNKFSIKSLNGSVAVYHKNKYMGTIDEGKFISESNASVAFRTFTMDKYMTSALTGRKNTATRSTDDVYAKSMIEVVANGKIPQYKDEFLLKPKRIESYDMSSLSAISNYITGMPGLSELSMKKHLAGLKPSVEKDFLFVAEYIKYVKDLGGYEEAERNIKAFFGVFTFTKYDNAKALYYTQRGDVSFRLKDYKSALDAYKKSIDAYSGIFQDHPEVSGNAKSLACAYLKIASFYFEYGEDDNALNYLNKSLNLSRRYFSDNDINFFEMALIAWNGVCDILVKKKDYPNASVNYSKTLEFIDREFDRKYFSEKSICRINDVYSGFAALEDINGKDAEAVKYLNRSLELPEKSGLKTTSLITGKKIYCLMQLYEHYSKAKKNENAYEILQKIDEILNKSPATLETQILLVNNLDLMFDGFAGDDKNRFFLKSLDIAERFYELLPEAVMNDAEMAKRYTKAGTLYYDKRNFETSSGFFKKAYDLFEKDLDTDDVNTDVEYIYINEKLQEIYFNLNDYDNSMIHCIKLVNSREKLLQKNISGGEQTETGSSLRKSDGERNLSVDLNRLGDLYFVKGNVNESIIQYKKSLALREKLFQSDDPNDMRDMSVSYLKLGQSYTATGDVNEGVNFYKKSMAIREMLRMKNPESPPVLRDLSVVYEKLGDSLSALNNHTEALLYYKNELSLSLMVYKYSPGIQSLRDLFISYAKTADASVKTGDMKNAFDYYKLAQEIIGKIYKNDPDNTVTIRECAANFNKIGDVYLKYGEDDLALKNYTQALPLYETLYKRNTANVFLSKELSSVYQKIGDLSLKTGDMSLALTNYTAYIKIEEIFIANDKTRLGSLSSVYLSLGDIYLKGDDYKKAAEYYGKSLVIREGLKSNPGIQSKKDMTVVYDRLGGMNFRKGDFNEALKYYRLDFDVEQIISDEKKDTASVLSMLQSMYNMALCYRALKDFQKCNELLKSVITKIDDMQNTNTGLSSGEYDNLKELSIRAIQ